MKIYLVRHAEVASNSKGIAYNNQKNEALTKKGREQARKLAKRLRQFDFDKIFISESRRTYQTILPLLLIKSAPLKKDKRLNDCNYGIFGSLTIKGAKEKYPDIFQKRQKDKYNIPIPRGESFKDVGERLDSFINDLKRENTLDNVLLVTHATNIKVFLIKYLRFSIKKSDLIHFGNTSISILDFDGKKFKPIMINDFSHLK